MNRKDEGPCNVVGGQAPGQVDRQHDPALCPTWCDREHLREAPYCGFQHDGAGETLWVPAAAMAGSEHRVSVVPSAVDGGPAALVARVELHIDETICALTPEEALQVADWLRDTAQMIGDGHAR